MWNWLSGIVDWLKSIAEGVVQIPLNLWNYIKDIPGQVWDFVKQIPSLVWGFFENSFSTLTSVFKNTYDFVKEIPSKILDGIKSIFVPREEDVNNSIERLKTSFSNTFGIGDFDLSGVMGVSTEISNKSTEVTILGYTFNFSFFDVTYIKRAVNDFRPYIRGFILLMLALYNINQFLSFITAGHLSLGNYININDSKNNSGGNKE